MTQEKMRKVITACVSAATVLLVVLLSFLIYQWVTIGVLNKRIANEKAEYESWSAIVEQKEAEENYFGSKEFYERAWIEMQMVQEKNQEKNQ